MVTAIVLTKNEEKNIAKCLAGLRFCNEVIVVDEYSTDRTGEIARRYGARVFQRHLKSDFAAQRNFGLEKSRGDWVLFVDADERVSAALAAEIKDRVEKNKSNGTNGFYIKRRDFVWGRELKHGESGTVKLLRLAKKNASLWKRAVHETWDVQGKTQTLENPLTHYPHQTLREFLFDVDWYSTLHARALYEEGVKSNLAKIIIWPVGKFKYGWILKLGFLDGTQGFVVAAMMSLHSFLAWSKLWLLQKKK
ncbi:MAG: glycosyltransferase family 2 protein [bacterium]|nr:glycosyltransferase family 2 protein [bacterium]